MFGKISSISLKYNLYSTFLKKKKKSTPYLLLAVTFSQCLSWKHYTHLG